MSYLKFSLNFYLRSSCLGTVKVFINLFCFSNEFFVDTMPLSRDFYERDTATVARELLGNVLLNASEEGSTSGRIVETEAYYGVEDPASRASAKKTKINEIMWDRGGLALVYMVHANWLFNVTTENKGTPGAVLIRALKPLEGIDLMRERRRRTKIRELTSGPGKLTQALGISKEVHKRDLTVPGSVSVLDSKEGSPFEIESSHRIGVTSDLERKLRFFVSGSNFVSC